MGKANFKDVLRDLIEKNGGLGRGNLERLSDKIREIKPDFSAAYLRRLLSGYPPSREDREAISQVLEPESERWMSMHWDVEDVDNRELATWAAQYTKSHVLVKKFVDDLLDRVSYRDKKLSENDAHIILRELYEENRWKVEIDLFQLQGQF